MDRSEVFSANSYKDKKQAALELLSRTINLCHQENRQDYVPILDENKKNLEKNEFLLVVCGECNRGKSSLINAFLEEDELCPVSALIDTNNISTIRYGEKERISVHFVNEAQKAGECFTQEVTRSQLRDYVTAIGNEHKHQGVESVEIELPNEKLKDGLVLIDTPGIGSLNIAHTATTMEILPYADGVIFVGGATSPLNDQELSFVEKIGSSNTPLLHAITHSDKAINLQEVEEANREKLATSLNAAQGADPRKNVCPQDLLVAAVSSTMKMEALKYNDQEALRDSNFSLLEEQVWRLLADVVNKRIYAVVSICCERLRMLNMVRQAEQKDLLTNSKVERENYVKQLEECISTTQSYSNDCSPWESAFSNEGKFIELSAHEELKVEFLRLDKVLGDYLSQEDYVSHPHLLAETMEAEYLNAYASVSRKINGMLSDAVKKAQQATGLSLSGAVLSGRVKATLTYSGIAKGIVEMSLIERLMTYGNAARLDIAVGVIGGGTAGAVAGSLIGGGVELFNGAGLGSALSLGYSWGVAIGNVLGGLIAAVARHKGNFSKMRANNIQFMATITMNQLEKPLQELKIRMQSSMKKDVAVLCEQYIYSMKVGIKERLASLKQTQKSIKESMAMAQGEAKQKLEQINLKIGELEKAITAAKKLAESVRGVNDTALPGSLLCRTAVSGAETLLHG